MIFGLSYALDILGSNNLSHSKSTAYLSVLIARELGLKEEGAITIYYSALLHDIGIASDYNWKLVDSREMKNHCEVGVKSLRRLPLSEEITDYVLYHHEYDNGTGPFGLKGDGIPRGAGIICLASAFDDEFGNTKKFDRELILTVREWTRKNEPLFSGEILRSFNRLVDREHFLLDYFNHETKYTLSDKIIVKDDVYYSSEDVEKFAHCFADIIDQRSPFTFRHSHGIAELAEKAAVHLGYDEKTQKMMFMSGLLHDIGKLHISTEILHKDSALSPGERFEINKHTYYTRKVLEQIEGFEEITNIAANHHERLDGTGYPYHLTGGMLTELEKVMAICDVYQALSEERPYRSKLSSDRVWEIIDEMVENKHLDKSLVSQMKQAF